MTETTAGRFAAPAAVLGCAAVVHAARGAEVDSLLWLGVLVCLLAEQALLRRGTDRRPGGFLVSRRPWVEATVLAVLAVLSVAAGSQWRIGSLPAKLVVAALGVLVLVVLFTRRAREPSQPERPAHVWPWLVIAMVAALVQLSFALVALATDVGAPTFSGVVDLALAEPAVRGVAFALWLLAGYYLVCRAEMLRRRR